MFDWNTGVSLSISLLSLNLHGYHPMREAPRWIEHRDGKIERAESKLFYFTREELERGDRKRLDLLAQNIAKLQPEILLFQEVAAGTPEDRQKNCIQFQLGPKLGQDSFGPNEVLRLAARLAQKGLHYEAALACRGNTGWWTEPTTFAQKRILRGEESQSKEIVFDYSSNPYPNGLLLEGTAVLVKAPWRILINREWRIPYRSDRPEATFFFQTVELARGPESNAPWILIANLHAGWELDHFEQAIAVRETIQMHLETARHSGPFLGVIFAGDFNAELYRPDLREKSEPSTLPWEVHSEMALDRSQIRESLLKMKNEPSRVDSALTRLDLLLASRPPRLLEAIETAQETGSCRPQRDIPSSCFRKERIDLAYATSNARVRNAYVLYPENDWVTLEGVSDHPGLFVQWALAPTPK